MTALFRTMHVLFLLLLAWAAGFSYYASSSLMLQPQRPEQKTEAIVVLTGGDGRIETGLRLLANGMAPELFISGVHPVVTMADITAPWTGPQPLPACCITLGYKAVSTQQNADETAAWVREKKIRSLRLVTSNYHMHRAYLEFHAALPDVRILIQPIVQRDITPRQPYFWIVMFSEYHKSLFRFLALLAAKVTQP